jgi:hypothetical protein
MRPILTIFLALTVASCIHTGFTPTTGWRFAARPPNCHLDLVLHGSPPYPYVVIGQVTTDSTMPGLFALGESNSDAVRRLREEACHAGAHGLLQVGASSQGVWTGRGFSKSTSGGAVAFVYVDPEGRPLRSPPGPRPMIHAGAHAAPPPAARP